MSNDDKIRHAFENKNWQEIKVTDSWQIFKIMAEFVDGFEKLAKIGPCVSIFGSARTKPDHVYYKLGEEIAEKLTRKGYGIITGGGFETPAEALFLEKRILSIPIREHYEQLCNAAALQKMGVPVIYEVDDDFNVVIEQWLNQKINLPKLQANNIPNTLQYLFDTYHP